ncbi:MAG: hypothetical protein WDW38_011522 [Sanguina aurantia]
MVSNERVRVSACNLSHAKAGTRRLLLPLGESVDPVWSSCAAQVTEGPHHTLAVEDLCGVGNVVALLSSVGDLVRSLPPRGMNNPTTTRPHGGPGHKHRGVRSKLLGPL